MAVSVAVPVGDKTADRKLIDETDPRIEKLKVGPYTSGDDVDFGPVVTAAAKDRDPRARRPRRRGGRRDWSSTGATSGCRATRTASSSVPHLFDTSRPDMDIYREEIFGPVLTTVRAGSYEEALGLAMDHEYGNGTAIFTRDGDAARDFANPVNVGMVGVNVPIPVPLAYHTFGGWKKSMFGDLNQHGSRTRSASIPAPRPSPRAGHPGSRTAANSTSRRPWTEPARGLACPTGSFSRSHHPGADAPMAMRRMPLPMLPISVQISPERNFFVMMRCTRRLLLAPHYGRTSRRHSNETAPIPRYHSGAQLQCSVRLVRRYRFRAELPCSFIGRLAGPTCRSPSCAAAGCTTTSSSSWHQRIRGGKWPRWSFAAGRAYGRVWSFALCETIGRRTLDILAGTRPSITGCCGHRSHSRPEPRAAAERACSSLPVCAATTPGPGAMALTSPPFSIGVEEEYLLVDRDSLDLADAPEGLMQACQLELEDQVSPEFLNCQIEIGTRPCRTIAEAREDLRRLRSTVAVCARPATTSRRSRPPAIPSRTGVTRPIRTRNATTISTTIWPGWCGGC